MTYGRSERDPDGSRSVARTIRGTVEAPGAETEILPIQRAADADRNRVIDHLTNCLELGLIPGEVFTARMEAAASARTHAELTELLRDVPGPPSPRAPWHQRARSVSGRRTVRRWLHLAGALGALCVMTVAPTVLYVAAGYQARSSALPPQIEHSGIVVALIWFFICAGLVLLVADIAWWCGWEDRKDK